MTEMNTVILADELGVEPRVVRNTVNWMIKDGILPERSLIEIKTHKQGKNPKGYELADVEASMVPKYMPKRKVRKAPQKPSKRPVGTSVKEPVRKPVYPAVNVLLDRLEVVQGLLEIGIDFEEPELVKSALAYAKEIFK